MRGLVLCACVGCGRIAFDPRDLAEPDAAMQGDAPMACASTFEANELPAGMETFGGGTVEVAGGRIRVAIPGVLDSDAGVTAMVAASHVGQATAIQVVTASSIPAASTAFGWHQMDTGLATHLEMDGTNLKFNTFDSVQNIYTEFVAVPYDPVAHAWWRLREQSGTVVAEVSSDGVDWNLFSMLPTSFDTSNIKWDFGVGAYVMSVAPAESSFDNLVDCTSSR